MLAMVVGPVGKCPNWVSLEALRALGLLKSGPTFRDLWITLWITQGRLG